jgi:tetratricopeptide (TPR) repeat protein
VHRDVKPSNLLLDETGKLWITDFGLARFQTNPSLTVTGELVGTVRYMSPEQLRCQPGLVDQRTDIYSLGATLYELATLRAAFPGEHQQELMRRIEYDEPTPPRRIDRSLPRDLETIILKALSKLRDDRYSTAAELADDLRRFLDGKPALARRPSRLERGCRWAQRHTRLVAVSSSAAVLMFAALTAGMLLLSHQKHRTQTALEASRANFQRAESNLLKAREVVDRFCTRVAGQLAEAAGFEPLRRELLGDALRYYRHFIDQSRGDPSVQAELARAYFRVGEISEQLGDDTAAVEAYRQSRHLLTRAFQENPSDTINAELALCDNNLGLLWARSGDWPAAERAYRQAIARQEALARSKQSLPRVRGELATSYNNLGLLMSQTDRASETVRWYAKAIGLQQQLVDDQPEAAEPRSALAATYNNLGYLHSTSDIEQAQQAYRAAVDLQRQLDADFPQWARLKSDLALTLNNLGALQSRAGEAQSAAESYRAAASLQQEIVRSAPLAVGFRRDLAVTYNNLGFLHHRQQQYDEAETAFERARTILTSLVTDYPQAASLHSSLGGVENNLGMVYEQRSQWTLAAQAYRRAIDQQKEALAVQRPEGESRFHEFLSTHYFNLGRVLRAAGCWQEAREAAHERKQLWPDHAAGLYHVACELSQAAAGLTEDEQQTCLDEAWQALHASVEAGYSDFKTLQAAGELELLRKRPQWGDWIDRFAAKPARDQATGTSP